MPQLARLSYRAKTGSARVPGSGAAIQTSATRERHLAFGTQQLVKGTGNRGRHLRHARTRTNVLLRTLDVRQIQGRGRHQECRATGLFYPNRRLAPTPLLIVVRPDFARMSLLLRKDAKQIAGDI